MADSRDILGKNRKFKGTSGVVMPKGSTAERADTESGEIRFNTTTELMEYYDGNQWKPIDAPPTISSISTSDATGDDTVLAADGSTIFTITITGGNFGIGLNVKFIGNTGTEYTAGNINRVSGSSITCTTLLSMGTSDDPYDVQVTNASGLSALLEDAFSFNAPPVFATASGTLGEIYNTQVISGTTLNAGATDAEGNAITHTIISGSLPGSGLSISSSTGAITGTLSGTPSLENYPFTVRAATAEGIVERAFSIDVIATPPVIMDFLVLAGGGGGGSGTGPYREGGGGGGAGGYRNSFSTEASGGGGSSESVLSLTRGAVYTITVGNGGAGAPPGNTGTTGQTSSISGTGITTVTSAGGGGGAQQDTAGAPGGSGGGAGCQNGTGGTGTANQGRNGGAGYSGNGAGAGGGGGASVAGSNGTLPANGGNGGAGLSSSITGTSLPRAGGGGAGGHANRGTGSDGGGSGGISGPTRATSAANHTGAGGGGEESNYASGGNGGSGTVILRMPTADYSGTTTGSPTVSTDGSDTVLVYTGSGSYTA
jgi:hypothetical protein